MSNTRVYIGNVHLVGRNIFSVTCKITTNFGVFVRLMADLDFYPKVFQC